MKKTPKAPAMKLPDVAEHVTTPAPELVLQVCPKCDANYNRNTLDKCPACGGPRPDATATPPPEQPASETQAPAAAPDAWPFLKIPADQGGVIVGTDERDGVRDLTPEDIGAAHEEMYLTSQNLREAEAEEKRLEREEKNAEAALKGTREALRKIEQKQLELGRELATFSEEIHTGKRRITIQVVETVTLQNELVITDARDGSVIERRTATANELDKARNVTTEMKLSKMNLTVVPDSPDAKGNPEQDVLHVSINLAAYKKTKKAIKSGLQEVQVPNPANEDDVYPISWQAKDGRSLAIVPRWVASRLDLLCEQDKALDFRIEKPETGGVQVEVTE